MVALRYAARVNGMGAIALTKLDVLTGFDKIKVCTEYEIEGKKYEHFMTNTALLEKAEPVYTLMDGWKEDISKCRSFDELPVAAQKYVEYIEKEAQVPVQLIGVGPDRDQTIIRGL
jgi:adenylosuccinate synthase